MGAHMEQLFSRHTDYIASDKTPRRTLNEIGRRLLSMFSEADFLALYRITIAEVHDFPDLARLLWRECMERGRGLLAEYLRTRRIGGPGYSRSDRAVRFICPRRFPHRRHAQPRPCTERARVPRPRAQSG